MLLDWIVRKHNKLVVKYRDIVDNFIFEFKYSNIYD